jgi:hypothetical protein
MWWPRVYVVVLCVVALLKQAVVQAAVSTGTGNLFITNSVSTASIPLYVKAVAEQDTNMMVVEVVDGTDKFVVNKLGNFDAAGTFTAGGDIGVSTSISTTGMTVTGDIEGDQFVAVRMTLTSTAAGTVPLILTGIASQTANFFEVQNVGGTNLLYLTVAGKLITSSTVTCTNLDASGAASLSGTCVADSFLATRLTLVNDDDANVPLLIEAATDQTGVLLVLETSDGTDKFTVSGDGNAEAQGTVQAGSFIGGVAWSLVSVSTGSNTRSTYGITDMGSDADGTVADTCLIGTAATWAKVTGEPTTLAGYSIDDEVGSSAQGTKASWLNTNCVTSEAVTLAELKAGMSIGNDNNNNNGGNRDYKNAALRTNW